ncbi:MAG: response regulator transcription factor [Acidimicrobiales bacterium]
MGVTATPGVLIADDHAPTRRMIRRSIEQRGFLVKAEVPDAHAAVRACGENDVDVALLDVRMPGGGIHAATIIGAEQPHVAIVMLTVSADDSDLFAAVSAGALGYLLKGGDPIGIPDALWRVLSGEAAIDGILTKRLFGEYKSRSSRQRLRNRLSNGTHLTQKEWEVLDLLNRDLSTTEIARRLFVADVTVRTHVAAIVRKLGASDRFEAVRFFRGTLEASDPEDAARP